MVTLLQLYNEGRTHDELGKTPWARLEETRGLIPTVETVKAGFAPVQEGYRTRYRAVW